MRRSVRTEGFRKQLGDLPQRVQEAAKRAFEFFEEDPEHPILERHDLRNSRRGRHRRGSFRASVCHNYRAICVVDDEDFVWYWIGSHEAYNVFTGSRRR